VHQPVEKVTVCVTSRWGGVDSAQMPIDIGINNNPTNKSHPGNNLTRTVRFVILNLEVNYNGEVSKPPRFRQCF
jgi:hypothetical protein